MAKKVACILTDRFEELEAIATIDILRRLGVQIDLYSLNNHVVIQSAHGVCLAQMLDFSKFNQDSYDALFIAGGAQYMELERNVNFLKVVKHFIDSNKYVGAICAAPTILGHLGLLRNKHYTCFSSMNENFGGIYEDKPFVVDGKLVTGKGPFAAIEFGLAFAEVLTSKELVEQLKSGSYYYVK